MRKTVKAWLIAAAVLMVAGSLIFAGVIAVGNWDLTRLSTVTYVTNTHEVSAGFDKISIDTEITEIEFIPTDDERCSIVCLEEEKLRHSATVQNETLIIDTIDTRKWYDFIRISLGTPKITVYLPQAEYTSLLIETNTGDVTIPKDFIFDHIQVNGDTSDVDCFASVSNRIEIRSSTGHIRIANLTADLLELTTDTGKINVNSVTALDRIAIETNTGSVKLTDISCLALTAQSDTGDISLKNLIAAGTLSIHSDTGDVSFDSSDATQISVKTSTGDVTGTLLSDKVFITDTSTGRIQVPKTTSGGICEIKTSTGDIKLEIN